MQGGLFLVGTLILTLALYISRQGNSVSSSASTRFIALCVGAIGSICLIYAFGVLAGIILTIAVVSLMGMFVSALPSRN